MGKLPGIWPYFDDSDDENLLKYRQLKKKVLFNKPSGRVRPVFSKRRYKDVNFEASRVVKPSSAQRQLTARRRRTRMLIEPSTPEIPNLTIMPERPLKPDKIVALTNYANKKQKAIVDDSRYRLSTVPLERLRRPMTSNDRKYRIEDEKRQALPMTLNTAGDGILRVVERVAQLGDAFSNSIVNSNNIDWTSRPLQDEPFVNHNAIMPPTPLRMDRGALVTNVMADPGYSELDPPIRLLKQD